MRTQRARRHLGRLGGLRAPVVAGLALALALLGLPPAASAAASLSPPAGPVGTQLSWLLGAAGRAPLTAAEIDAHFDAAFLAQVSPTVLDQGLEAVGSGPMTLRSLSGVTGSSLVAVVSRGSVDLTVHLDVDPQGLISGLLLTPIVTLTSWTQVDHRLKSIAPGIGFLAARLGTKGACTTVHAIEASTPRPLGSMFKLFVLGALANAIRAHRISWNQDLTLTQGAKVGGSGTLAQEPDGTRLTVEQAAADMISASDNTAADMLLGLVGRSAVESQVRRWSTHPSLDVPFLSVSELFALKYGDYPTLADRYLSLGRSARAAYLASTIDKFSAAAEVASTQPRDVNSIEWFASPMDLCRALSGLHTLAAERGLGPIASVMSINDGGIELSRSIWPTIWFKGGSEAGVLTLGYLARDASGHTDVVVVLTENPRAALDEESDAVSLLSTIAGAFGLLRRA